MREIELEIVPGRGVAPLEFEMSEEVARDLMAAWDTPVREASGGERYFNAVDDTFSVDVRVNFETADRITSFEIWRPSEEGRKVTVRLGDLRLLNLPAEGVLRRLRADGYVLDESELYYPIAVSDQLYLGFNREGGDYVDEESDDGLSSIFNSVCVAPASYYDRIHAIKAQFG